MSSRTAKSGRITIDDLLFDIFELNLQGLRSIGTLFVNPRAYYEAADDPRWFERYTPSIRLWFSVMAVLFFFRFIWAGEDTPIVAAFAEQFEAAGVFLPEGMTYQDLGLEVATWTFAVMPFTLLLLMTVLASIYPFWGQKTTLATRQRYVFATNTPSSVLTVFSTLGLVFLPPSQFLVYSFLSAFVTLMLDGVTGYRGAFRALSGFGRVWRAALLSLSIMIATLLANFAAQIVGGAVVGYTYAKAQAEAEADAEVAPDEATP